MSSSTNVGRATIFRPTSPVLRAIRLMRAPARLTSFRCLLTSFTSTTSVYSLTSFTSFTESKESNDSARDDREDFRRYKDEDEEDDLDVLETFDERLVVSPCSSNRRSKLPRSRTGLPSSPHTMSDFSTYAISGFEYRWQKIELWDCGCQVPWVEMRTHWLRICLWKSNDVPSPSYSEEFRIGFSKERWVLLHMAPS